MFLVSNAQININVNPSENIGERVSSVKPQVPQQQIATNSSNLQMTSTNYAYSTEQLERMKAKININKEQMIQNNPAGNSQPGASSNSNVNMSKPQSSNIPSGQPSQMHNYSEFIRRQNLKFQKLCEMYRQDPEKFKREIGAEEFAKFENVVRNKNLNLGGNPSLSTSNFSLTSPAQSNKTDSNSNLNK
jgi:hypothetical protein